MAAATIANLAVIVVLIGLTLAAYFITYDYSGLWHVPISSYFNAEMPLPYISWWNLSFLAYLGLFIVGITLCQLLFMGITFILTIFMENTYLVFFTFIILLGAGIWIPGTVPLNNNLVFMLYFNPFELILNPHEWLMGNGTFTIYPYYEAGTIGVWALLLGIHIDLDGSNFNERGRRNMRIVGYEVRKLLNLKILGLVLLISFLFYQLFLSFNFEYFPNGRPLLDHYNVSKQMIAKYGSEMNVEEFEDFKETYKEEVKRAGHYLQSRDDFAEVGVTTYRQFRNMDDSKENLNNLYGEVMFEKGADVFWELQASENIMENYKRKKESFMNETSGIENVEWKKNMVEGNSLNAILPNLVLDNYNNLIRMMAILIILSVMIVVGRIHLVDQNNNVISLQYTANVGRGLFKKKIVASLVTAILLTTFFLLAFFLLYTQNDTRVFFESSIQSFGGFIPYWIDISFLWYIVLTVVGVYLLAIVAASIAIFSSRIVTNYITLIGAQVPVAVILSLLIMKYLISQLMSIHYPMYLTIGTYAGLLCLGSLLLLLRWKKERGLDIV